MFGNSDMIQQFFSSIPVLLGTSADVPEHITKDDLWPQTGTNSCVHQQPGWVK